MFEIQKLLVIYLVTCFIREYHCERHENDAIKVVNLSVMRCQSAVRNLTILLDSFLSHSLNFTTVSFTFFPEFSTTPEVPSTSESIEFLPTENPQEISTLINHFTTTDADMNTFTDEISSFVTDATISPHKTSNLPSSSTESLAQFPNFTIIEYASLATENDVIVVSVDPWLTSNTTLMPGTESIANTNFSSFSDIFTEEKSTTQSFSSTKPSLDSEFHDSSETNLYLTSKHIDIESTQFATVNAVDQNISLSTDTNSPGNKSQTIMSTFTFSTHELSITGNQLVSTETNIETDQEPQTINPSEEQLTTVNISMFVADNSSPTKEDNNISSTNEPFPHDNITTNFVVDHTNQFVLNQSNDAITNPPNDLVTYPPNDSVTNQLNDSITNLSNDSVPNQSNESVTNPLDDSVTNPSNDSVTDPPNDSVPIQSNDSVTNLPNDLGPNQSIESITNPSNNSVSNESNDSFANQSIDSVSNESVTNQTNISVTNISNESVSTQSYALVTNQLNEPAFNQSNDFVPNPSNDLVTNYVGSSQSNDSVTIPPTDSVQNQSNDSVPNQSNDSVLTQTYDPISTESNTEIYFSSSTLLDNSESETLTSNIPVLISNLLASTYWWTVTTNLPIEITSNLSIEDVTTNIENEKSISEANIIFDAYNYTSMETNSTIEIMTTNSTNDFHDLDNSNLSLTNLATEVSIGQTTELIVTDAITTNSNMFSDIHISTETTESSTEIFTMSEITTNDSYSTESHFQNNHSITTMENDLSTDLTTNEVTDTNIDTTIDSQEQTSNLTDSSITESLNPEITSMVNVSESTLVDSNIGVEPKLSESDVANSSSVVSGGSPDGNHTDNEHSESVNITSHTSSISTIDPSGTLNGEHNFRRKRSIYEDINYNWGLDTNRTLSKINFYLSSIIENPTNITHSQALDVQTIQLQILVNEAYKNSELVDLSKLSKMNLRAQYILGRINETMRNLQQEIEEIAHAEKQTTAAISLVSSLLLLVIIGLILVFLRPMEHMKEWRASKRGSIRVSLTPVTRSSSFSSDGISLDNASYISHNDRIDQLSTLQMYERNPMPKGVHRTQSGSSRSESVFSVASTIQLSNDQFVASATKQMKLSRI